MAALTRADFTLEPKRVSLKDGREVVLKRLSALERAEYLGLCKSLAEGAKTGGPVDQLKAVFIAAGSLVSLALIDDTGTRVFQTGEEATSALSEPLMDELCDLISDLNGLRTANDPNA